MTQEHEAETCFICDGPGPLRRDDHRFDGEMLCQRCYQLVDMGPEWMEKAKGYLDFWQIAHAEQKRDASPTGDTPLSE
jgi:hypothetical protein